MDRSTAESPHAPAAAIAAMIVGAAMRHEGRAAGKKERKFEERPDEESDVAAALRRDHGQLRAALNRAMLEPGPVGEAASALARLCLLHFKLEETIVFPAFVVLRHLALHDHVGLEMARVLALVARFARVQSVLSRQHKALGTAIGALWEAAYEDGNRQILDLASRLRTHIATEDSVIYPAVLLIGKYLEQTSAVRAS